MRAKFTRCTEMKHKNKSRRKTLLRYFSKTFIINILQKWFGERAKIPYVPSGAARADTSLH